MTNAVGQKPREPAPPRECGNPAPGSTRPGCRAGDADDHAQNSETKIRTEADRIQAGRKKPEHRKRIEFEILDDLAQGRHRGHARRIDFIPPQMPAWVIICQWKATSRPPRLSRRRLPIAKSRNSRNVATIRFGPAAGRREAVPYGACERDFFIVFGPPRPPGRKRHACRNSNPRDEIQPPRTAAEPLPASGKARFLPGASGCSDARRG